MTCSSPTSPGRADALQLVRDAERALREVTDLVARLGDLTLAVPRDESTQPLRADIERVADLAAGLLARLLDIARPDGRRAIADLPHRSAGEPASPGLVLFVDDEPMIRTLGERVLAAQGYEVIATADGEEALEVFDRSEGRVSVVVLDLTMPRMSGHEVLHELARRTPSVPVVVASGYSERADALNLPQVRGVLPKPYRPTQLIAAIRAALATK